MREPERFAMPLVMSGQPSEERRRLRAQKGVAVRLGRTEEAARLDTEIRAAALDAHIRRVVDAAPPLTAEQRDRLAVLLRGGEVA